MSRWHKAAVVRIVMFACVFLSGCFYATPINITGTWVGTMQWTTGPASGISYPIVLNLTHENNSLSGTVTLVSHGSNTFDLPINQGSAHGRHMSLLASGVNDQVQPNPTVEFKIDGDYDQTSMSGDGTQSINGTTYKFDWEATLTTEPVPAALEG
jgi:hypothetical protein